MAARRDLPTPPLWGLRAAGGGSRAGTSSPVLSYCTILDSLNYSFPPLSVSGFRKWARCVHCYSATSTASFLNQKLRSAQSVYIKCSLSLLNSARLLSLQRCEHRAPPGPVLQGGGGEGAAATSEPLSCTLGPRKRSGDGATQSENDAGSIHGMTLPSGQIRAHCAAQPGAQRGRTFALPPPAARHPVPALPAPVPALRPLQAPPLRRRSRAPAPLARPRARGAMAGPCGRNLPWCGAGAGRGAGVRVGPRPG